MATRRIKLVANATLGTQTAGNALYNLGSIYAPKPSTRKAHGPSCRWNLYYMSTKWWTN